MSEKTHKCTLLHDRVPKGNTIAAECGADNDDQCPKIRSMKLAVNPQCWKLKLPAEKKKPAAPAPVEEKAPAKKPAKKGEKPAESLAVMNVTQPGEKPE